MGEGSGRGGKDAAFAVGIVLILCLFFLPVPAMMIDFGLAQGRPVPFEAYSRRKNQGFSSSTASCRRWSGRVPPAPCATPSPSSTPGSR
jgi:hypothetical protein